MIKMMNKRDISILLIRILALYLFLQALSVLPMSIKVGVTESIFFIISQEFIIFLLSAFLWFAAPYLSKIILKEQSDCTEANYHLEWETFEYVLFSFVGLILIVVAIPGFSGILMWKLAYNSFEPDIVSKSEAIAGYYSHITKYIMEFFIGLILFIRPNFITSIKRLIRKTD